MKHNADAVRFHFPFIKTSRYWLILSAVLLLVSIVSLVVQGFNLGVDFKGGVLTNYRFEQPVTVADIRSVYTAHGVNDVVIQEYAGSGGHEFKVTAPVMTDEERLAVQKDLEDKLGKLEILSQDQVSATVGSELRSRGIWAFVLATLMMILYMSIRFDVPYALAGVAGMIHNILILMGIFSVLRLPVDASFITAVLTAYGYSIHDSIIIFDRVRERLGLGLKEPLEETVNISINQTLSRTINTVVTVLLALLAMFFFAGESVHLLVLALIIGIVVGTYSTIFIANPIFIYLVKFMEKRGYRRRLARAS
ncbi:MAG: protein translocase subunit SecF [Clostridiales bacterium]|nr:protein translocase subunit SecF [Clostridiales bacterium]